MTFYFRFCIILDISELAHFRGKDKGKGISRFAHACRPADPVNIILIVARDVIIDNRFDTPYINTACCNIGGDQYGRMSPA